MNEASNMVGRNISATWSFNSKQKKKERKRKEKKLTLWDNDGWELYNHNNERGEVSQVITTVAQLKNCNSLFLSHDLRSCSPKKEISLNIMHYFLCLFINFECVCLIFYFFGKLSNTTCFSLHFFSFSSSFSFFIQWMKGSR